ncbi:hypothetical protein X777_13164 [Ooceraea biroi]|uniref:Uncharacterized protein n=1 Tax=Ooceraea biroi TaxID=2015173 RepID=A0A026W0R7_OOCBI|nr:hypothetical protein X777_13164 [Ooceraea biroi]
MAYLKGVVRSAIIAMTHCDDGMTVLLLNLLSVTGRRIEAAPRAGSSKSTDLSLDHNGRDRPSFSFSLSHLSPRLLPLSFSPRELVSSKSLSNIPVIGDTTTTQWTVVRYKRNRYTSRLFMRIFLSNLSILREQEEQCYFFFFKIFFVKLISAESYLSCFR